MDILSPFISVILTDSSTGSPEHVLISIQAMRGLLRLHAPCIVPCIISFSSALFPHDVIIVCWLPCFRVSNSSLFTPALFRTHSLVFFAVHETRRIFLSPFISKVPRHVSSFFLSVQLSQPYIAALALSLVMSLLKLVNSSKNKLQNLTASRSENAFASTPVHTYEQMGRQIENIMLPAAQRIVGNILVVRKD